MLQSLLSRWILAAASSAFSASPVAPSGPLLVSVHLEGTDVSEQSVRDAIATELHALAVRPEDSRAAEAQVQISVSYRAQTNELIVSYSKADRGTMARVVPRPVGSEELASSAARIAAELAQDQNATSVAAAVPEPRKLEPAAAVEPRPKPPSAPFRPGSGGSKAEDGSTPRGPRPIVGGSAKRRLYETTATASFVYPLATNYEQPDIKTHLEFNLLYGRVGELDGLGLGALSVVDGEVEGGQLAVIGNRVTETAQGAQISLVFNSVGREAAGLQVAGVVNHAGGDFEGLALAGGANLSAGSITGAQLSLFGGNYTGGAVQGFQLAPLLNVARGSVQGGQVSALLNRGGDVAGAQFGLINIAGRVQGLQFGLVNVADEVDGVPIGLVSVSKSGGVHPTTWVSTSSYGNFGIKFATRYTYSTLSVSLHERDGEQLAGPGFSLGATIPLMPRTFADLDLGATHLLADTECCSDGFFAASTRAKDQTVARLRGMLRYQFLPHLSAFAGVGLDERIRYPLDEYGDADPEFRFGPEVLGGIEL